MCSLTVTLSDGSSHLVEGSNMIVAIGMMLARFPARRIRKIEVEFK